MESFVVLVFAFLAALMFMFSYARGDLTAGQVWWHRHDCYSGVSHMGLWGCLLILPFLCGIIWTYHEQWDRNDMFLAGIIGLALNHLMHSLWLKNGPADHNLKKMKVDRSGKQMAALSGSPHDRYALTGAGFVHYFYMTAVLMLVILFFFFTDGIYAWHLFWVSIILGLYVALTTLVLNLIRQKKLDTVALLTTLVVWIVLAARIALA